MKVDRISSIPDDILQHILSLLETLNAAQTSLLSKRWRYLWTYTSQLNFKIYLPTIPWCYHIEKRKVCSAISQHKASILHRFRLNIHNDGIMGLEFTNEVLTWPEDVADTCKLPHGIFYSGNLHVMEIASCVINVIGSINLARVETLSLIRVHASDEVFNLLISSSKAVKKLEFEPSCKTSNIELSLQELRQMKLTGVYDEIKFIVDAPKLREVNLCCQGKEFEFSLRNSWDLKYAILDYGTSYNGMLTQFKDMVCELGVARALMLRCCLHRALPLDLFENCPLFYNVKQLEVTIDFPSSVVGILNLFPNLEEFVFKCQKRNTDYEDEDDYYRDFSVYCLRHSLRRIELKNFRDLSCQTRLAEFLVKNAMALERMCLTKCHGPFKRILETKSKLKRRRACKTAKITRNAGSG